MSDETKEKTAQIIFRTVILTSVIWIIALISAVFFAACFVD